VERWVSGESDGAYLMVFGAPKEMLGLGGGGAGRGIKKMWVLFFG